MNSDMFLLSCVEFSFEQLFLFVLALLYPWLVYFWSQRSKNNVLDLWAEETGGGEVSLHKPKQFWIKQSNAFSKWMFFWFVFFLFFFSLQLNSVVSYIFRSGSPSKSRIRSTLAQGDTLYSPVLSARAGLVISILLEECRLFFFLLLSGHFIIVLQCNC